MTNYTTAWFRDKLFDYALEKYKEHWHRYGKHDCHRPGSFVESQSFQDSYFDNEIVHDAMDNMGEEQVDKILNEYIESGDLEIYLHTKMKDYATDLARKV